MELGPWYCDVCGETIRTVDEGYVIWQDGPGGRSEGFLVIHQGRCDSKKDYPNSYALEDFIGADGLQQLLGFLSPGPLKLGSLNSPERRPVPVGDLDEFVDFFRRMQTPGYEQARRRFFDEDVQAEYADSNEIYPYTEEAIEHILGKP